MLSTLNTVSVAYKEGHPALTFPQMWLSCSQLHWSPLMLYTISTESRVICFRFKCKKALEKWSEIYADNSHPRARSPRPSDSSPAQIVRPPNLLITQAGLGSPPIPQTLKTGENKHGGSIKKTCYHSDGWRIWSLCLLAVSDVLPKRLTSKQSLSIIYVLPMPLFHSAVKLHCFRQRSVASKIF